MRNVKDDREKVFVDSIYSLPEDIGYDGDRGVARGDLGDPVKSAPDIQDNAKIIFSWQPWRKHRFDSDAENYMRKQYFEHQDIPLANSISIGGKQIVVWVSGRITETVTEINPKAKKGEPGYKEVTSEIVEPFSFVK